MDIPVGSRGYDPRRDCLREGCVVAQIERDERILGDRSLLTPARAEALRFLIHVVGDIHQPLHAADNGDKSGNGVRVVLGRRRTNMHAVWDGDVVRALGRDAGEVAAVLRSRINQTGKAQLGGGRRRKLGERVLSDRESGDLLRAWRGRGQGANPLVTRLSDARGKHRQAAA